MKFHKLIIGFGAWFLLSVTPFGHADATQLPRYDITTLSYKGAFRLPNSVFGEARLAWTNGEISIKPNNESFYITGSNKQTIAEFALPNLLSKSRVMAEIPIIGAPIQNFSEILSRAESGNGQGIDQIVGLAYIGNKLIVNAARYYDGSASNDDTTLIIEDPERLAESSVRGFLKLEGKNRAAGWISPVPNSQIKYFGHDYIAGHASNLPINARNSMGPSAFLISSNGLLDKTSGDYVESTQILGFGINNLLSPDPQNVSLTNNLWTELSTAEYGFIVPGTNTYMTIGTSGGHEKGIGYKITQDNGYQCGGFCSYDYKDNYNYVWLWDVEDLKKSFDGQIEPSDIKPYYSGRFEVPFEKSKDGSYTQNSIIGATLSPKNELYVVLGAADKLQSEYEGVPVVLVFDLYKSVGNLISAPNPPTYLWLE